MVNINDFRTLVNYITRKANVGNTTTTPDFDLAADYAQMMPYSMDYETFVKTKVVSNYLQTFLKINNVNNITADNTIIPYPSDFQYVSSVGTLYDGKQNDATLVDNADWREMLRPNSLNYPTPRHPKYQQIGIGIQFAPNIQTVTYLDYFSRPRKPHWAYTIENNRQVYDPNNSVNFEWDEFNMNRIIAYYLQYVGISLKDTEIAVFAQQFTAETQQTV